MTKQANGAPTQYRIGAVSRLTGISPDALRIWERRYAAVSPRRSPGGGRLYSPQDVARLRLMKQLVDAGDAIGEIATLNLDALQGRTAEAQRLPFAAGVLTEAAACRVLLVGESLARETEAAGGTLTGITPVARYTDIADFEARVHGGEADVLVIEQATLHNDTAKRVLDEGVNIPQIERAFILASTTVERQWVQRRGRVLRKCDAINKTLAHLHDFIVAPPDPRGTGSRAILKGDLN